MALTQSAIFSFNKEIATNQSLGASFDTEGYEVKEAKTLFIQAVWSGGGSPVGNFELQASSDNVEFTRIQGTVLSVIGNSGSDGWNLQSIGYPYIRVRYVRTSGTGTCKVTISGKTI